MRIVFTLACAAGFIALGASDHAPDDISWGPPDHGLRFGIAFGPASPEPQIRLVFQNVDRPECLVPLAAHPPRAPGYSTRRPAHRHRDSERAKTRNPSVHEEADLPRKRQEPAASGNAGAPLLRAHECRYQRRRAMDQNARPMDGKSRLRRTSPIRCQESN